MGARAEKNPLVGSYPDITTPLQVTNTSPDPRPGNEDAIPWSHGTGIPDPIGLIKPFSGIGAKFPKGEQAKRDKSLGAKGKG